MGVILQVVVRVRRTIAHHVVRDDICKPFGRSVAEEVVRSNLRLAEDGRRLYKIAQSAEIWVYSS